MSTSAATTNGSESRAQSGGRIASLDGLRGLAVIGTLLIHYEVRSWPYQSGLLWPTWLVVSHGWLGVECFFVLSGFLITGILLDSKGSGTYWRSYYGRRALRVFPLYYFALVVAFVLLPLLGSAAFGAEPVRASTQLWYWTYLSNVLIAFRGWGAAPRYIAHFWTMAIEEQFYLVWPLVVYTVDRKWLGRVAWGCVVVSVVARVALFAATGDYRYGWMLSFSRFDGLAIGAVCALWLRERGAEACRRDAARYGVWLGALVLLVSYWRHWGNFQDKVVGTVGLTLWSLVMGCVVLWLVTAERDARVARILENPALRKLGMLGYGIYVWHYFVLIALQAHGFRLDAVIDRVGSLALGHVIFVGVNATLTYLVAHVSWRLIEQPCLALKRYFPYRPSADVEVEPAGRVSPWPGSAAVGEVS